MKNLTVIISVYNGENHISRSLDSIKMAKDSEKVKVIVVNDGSTDNTLNILESYEMENLKIIDFKENVRPGIARNYMIDLVDTEYFMVLDADDELRYSIFSELKNYENKKYDLIKFNHMYNNSGVISFDKLPCYDNGELYGNDIEILATDNFYSVGRIYNTEFIRKNGILYSESIYYEDINFVLGAYTRAKTALVLPNIFLQINIMPNSATREKFRDDFHIISINKAIIESFENNKFVNKEIANKVWNQLAKKVIVYLQDKCPEELREESSLKVFNTLKKYIPDSDFSTSYLILENNFSQEDLIRVGAVNSISDIKNIDKFKIPSKAYGFLVNQKTINRRKIQKMVQKKYSIPTNYALVKFFEESYKSDKNKEIILFMGFDYQFRGNSKYKFIEEFSKGKEVYFVTNDINVPAEYRIKPYSNEHYFLLAHAKKVYLESFVDKWFVVGNNTEIIQLWHGTPIKKMLLDSNEKYFSNKNLGHKKNKIENIQKFSQFCIYNVFEEEKFRSAFNLKNNQLKMTKCPRINFLKENVKNIDKFKIKYKIPQNKKIISYVPTWRDYSFEIDKKYGLSDKFFRMLRQENQSKILNDMYDKFMQEYEITHNLEIYLTSNVIEQLEDKNEIPDLDAIKNISEDYYEVFTNDFIIKTGYKNGDYHVITKPHQFTNINFINDLVNNTVEIDTQELILISDICISDYSSIIFDYLEIDKKVYLLWDDIDLFEEYRGLYPEIKSDFENIIAYDEDNLYRLILSGEISQQSNKYLNTFE